MKKIYFLFIAFLGLSLATYAQPGVCMVTVDDSSKHNIIVYDKSQFSIADSFILWRETNTAGVYARIMAQDKNALSQFMDMDTAADPNVKLNRYKLQIYDAVGGYSQLGPYHTVLYCLQNVTTYAWNLYDIEGVGTGQVNKYMLLRDDNGLNQWHAIDSMTNTTQNAVDPIAASFPNGLWRLTTKWAISCSSSMRQDGHNETQAQFVKSKSNITNNKVSGINPLKASWVNLYPNPAADKVVLRLNFPLAQKSTLKLYNALGGEVKEIVLPAGKDELEINVSELPKGMYVAEFTNASVKINKRLAVQ